MYVLDKQSASRKKSLKAKCFHNFLRDFVRIADRCIKYTTSTCYLALSETEMEAIVAGTASLSYLSSFLGSIIKSGNR